MKRNRKKTTLTQRGAYLKTRIAGNRRRAEFVGIVYLLSIIALAAVSCLWLFDLSKQPNAPLGVTKFWREFMPKNLKAVKSWTDLLGIVNASIYALMLLGCVINVIRGLGKLCWLFKKKASKTYAFNRNVYAMEDLGNIFSGSYAVILTAYFMIAVLCGEAHPNLLMYITLGGGLVIHLFAGFVGGKVRYYDIVDNEIVEDVRHVGRGTAFLRNVLQLVAVFAMLYFFQKVSVLHTFIGPLLEKGGIKNYVSGKVLGYVGIALQLVTFICLLPLIKHATATTEYNLDGAKGAGMKTFRVFAFFVFLASAAMVACKYFIGEASVKLTMVDGANWTSVEIVKGLNINAIILGSIALVMFIIEVIMRNMPGFKKNTPKDKEVETDYNYSNESGRPAPAPHPSSPYINVPLYITLDNKGKASVTSTPEEEDEEEETMEEETYEVNCPHCGKKLRVLNGPEYHRCPVCGKVFQIRKVSKDVIV